MTKEHSQLCSGTMHEYSMVGELTWPRDRSAYGGWRGLKGHLFLEKLESRKMGPEVGGKLAVPRP